MNSSAPHAPDGGVSSAKRLASVKLAGSKVSHWAAMALVALGLHAGAAHAAINSFVAGMAYSGTAPFGATAPGDDASKSNAVVRTNDTVGYTVGYSITPNDTNGVLRLQMGASTLPGSYVGPALTSVAVFKASNLPGGGSGCQNIQVSAPLTAAELTAFPATKSGVSADGQTIVCMQTSPAGAATNTFIYDVLGTTPNGTTIAPPTITYQSDNNAANSSPTPDNNGVDTFGMPTLTVSAAPRWNVRKLSNSTYYGSQTGPNGEPGFIMPYFIGVYAQGSRKGLEAINGDFKVFDDYSSAITAGLPGARLVTWKITNPAGTVTDFSSTGVSGCGNYASLYIVSAGYADNGFYFVNDRGNVALTSGQSVYTVPKGGECSASAVNDAAKTATLTLAGTDFSLNSYPTRAGTNVAGAIIVDPSNPDAATNQWWVADKTILIWLPAADFSGPYPQTKCVTNVVTSTAVSVTGIANVEPVSTDNSKQQCATYSADGSFSKVAAPIEMATITEGFLPPLFSKAVRDSSVTGDGIVNQAAPKQLLLQRNNLNNSGTTTWGAGFVCDKLDNARYTYFDITSSSVAQNGSYNKDAGTGILQLKRAAAYDGMNVRYRLGVGGPNLTSGTWSTMANVSNEYTAPSNSLANSTQAADDCSDSGITWFSSLTALRTAGFTEKNITRVRMDYDNYPESVNVMFFIPVVTNSTYSFAVTDTLTAGTHAAGDPVMNGTFIPNQSLWSGINTQGSTEPATAVDRRNVSDAIKIVETEYIQINKLSPNYPVSGQLVPVGGVVDYNLQINASSGTNTHTQDITVWDVLPNYLTYNAGSSTLAGATIADPVCATSGLPTALFPTQPLAAGTTACSWVLPNQLVRKADVGATTANIDLLSFKATVSTATPANTQLLNTSFADSVNNLFRDAVYGGAGTGFACNAGQNCKFGNWLLSTSASPGMLLNKQVSQALVPVETGFTYTLQFAAIGNALGSARIIDVLPFNGDGRTPTTNYVGPLKLTSAIALPAAGASPTTVADPAAVVFYTANTNRPAIILDPYNSAHNYSGLATNSATTTNWCTAAQIGTSSNCPATYGDVTAFVVFSKVTGAAPYPAAGPAQGTILPGDLYKITVPVQPTGNNVSNVYTNAFTGDSPSLLARLPSSNQVTTRVTAPDLITTKTVSPVNVTAGQSAVFTVTVKNNTGTDVGPIENLAGTVITMTDTLPAYLQFATAADIVGGSDWNCSGSTPPRAVTCTYIGVLPKGVGSTLGAPITIATTVISTAPTVSNYANTATVGMTGQTELPTSNNPSTAVINITGLGYNVSGTVFNDVGGLVSNSFVDGTGTEAAGTLLTAYLVKNNIVVATSDIASGGTYSFANVFPDTGYTVVLANQAPLAANGSIGIAPPTAGLPTGWSNTGEVNGTTTTAADATNSGTGAAMKDGITAPFAVVNADVPNRNFGIEQPPVTGTTTYVSRQNPAGTTTYAVDAGAFTGTLPTVGTAVGNVVAGSTNATDPLPGAVTSITFTTFPDDANTFTVGGVTYTATTWAALTPAQKTFTPAQLAANPISVDPLDGTRTVDIPYLANDAAGLPSATAGHVILPFTPVYKVSGTIYNDANGNTDSFVNGTPVNGAASDFTTLTAYLVDSAGNIVASADVDTAGDYVFNNVVPANGYSVVLSNVAGVTGAASALNTTAANKLPTGWVNTGEVTGVSGTATNVETGAAIADAKAATFNVVATDVPNVNFGIEQPPVAGTTVYTTVPNPGTTVNLTVGSGAFAGTLPTSGITATSTNATDPTTVTGGGVTNINFPSFPASGATSITINGVKYVNSPTPGPGETTFPAAGLTVPLAGLTVTVDPIDGPQSIVIPYYPIDAAGLKSTTSGSVTVVVDNPGKIDVVKAVGVPKQVGTTGKVFEVPYSVVVGNVGATSPTVYNVQADDNLKLTYPTASTIVVSSYAVSAATGTPAANCAVASPTFLGTAAASKMLSGTGDLAGGQSCVITFVATVDFGVNPVPLVAQNNTVYASGMGSNSTPNTGYTVPDSGTPTAPPGNTTTDVSVTATTATTGVPGTLPPTPPLPPTSGGDPTAGVPTPVILTAQKIDVVKAVGVPKQIAAKVYEVPYKVVVGNIGASSPTVYNVQADDNLKSTFPTATSIAVSGYTVTPVAPTLAANCMPAVPAYAGTATASKMLSGTGDLAGGQSCLITFIATVDFGVNPVPVGVAQNNTVYASGVATDSVVNPGYIVTDAGVATAPSVATTVDVSVDNVAARPPAGSAPGTPPTVPALPPTRGSDPSAGVPTPVVLTPQKIDVVKAVGTYKQTGAKTFEVPYSVVVGNVGASSPTVYNVQADDNLKSTFPTATTITVSGYTVAPVAPTPAANCTPAVPAYAGTAAASKMLSGTGDLAGGQACVITFVANVDFGANPVPVTVAQNNSVYASGVGADTVVNPGYTVTDTGVATPPSVATTTDISVDSVASRPPAGSPVGTPPSVPTLPATPGADPAPGVPTPVLIAPQKIDVVKAAGVPLQVAPKKFLVDYSVVVGNVGASSPTVFNVQANDNLKLTYPTAASITVSNYTVAPVAPTPAANCTAANPAFAGTAAASAMLSGTNDLLGGQSCVITFKVLVDFGAADIPVVPQNNTVYASGVGSDAVANPGYKVTDAGVATPPAVATTTDISVTAPPTVGEPGTVPVVPTLPATPGADVPAGVPTPVVLVGQKIDTVKAVGVPKQVGPKVFEVNYSVVVANVCKAAPLTCATTPTVYNVQANDNLANTFPTASSIVVSNYAVANGANGAVCTAATPAFAGTAAASAMLSGVNDLSGGQTCIITFKATVDFGANPIPLTPQNNTVYASGTGANTIVNPGYTYDGTGKPVPPANASTTDISATAPPTTGAPGTLPATPVPPTLPGGDSELGVPTPIILTVEEDGELQIKKSTITKEASAGDVVEYSIVVTNTSSNPVKTKITDTPPTGFEYVAGSAKIGAISVASTSDGSSLVFDVGTIAAKSAIVLTYKMKLGDAVEAGDAKNCVSASGVNTLTANNKESGQSCATVIIKTGLFLEKRVNVNKAEIGDSVEYSLRVKSVGGTTKNVTITDNLPLGFKLIEGTVKVIRAGVTSAAANPAGSPGPALTFNVGTVANKEVVEIRYRVRLGVGADLGDGINKAQAKAPYATSSLVATAKVLVTRGVFTREACIVGKVFVDCNQNKVQDKCEAGSKDACEPGIPGVRLYMEDGTNITTDENGQYSICGVRAISHVMQVDMTTMPVGSRMGLTSNENLGSGKSLMMNIKSGELHRADFIESSCYPKILEQVEQRRKNSAGIVNVPLVQKGQDKPGIVFDSKEQELLAPALRGVK